MILWPPYFHLKKLCLSSLITGNVKDRPILEDINKKNVLKSGWLIIK